MAAQSAGQLQSPWKMKAQAGKMWCQAGSQIRVPVADYLGKFLEAENGEEKLGVSQSRSQALTSLPPGTFPGFQGRAKKPLHGSGGWREEGLSGP